MRNKFNAIRNFLMPLIMTILLCLITACSITESPKIPTKAYPFAEKEFIHYINEFEKHYGKKVSKVKMVWENYGGTNIGGKCNMITRQIWISSDKWNRWTPMTRMSVIFHELGHCVLGRPHRQYDSKKLCPTSLMAWDGIPDICFAENFNYYMHELFQTGYRSRPWQD